MGKYSVNCCKCHFEKSLDESDGEQECDVDETEEMDTDVQSQAVVNNGVEPKGDGTQSLDGASTASVSPKRKTPATSTSHTYTARKSKQELEAALATALTKSLSWRQAKEEKEDFFWYLY